MIDYYNYLKKNVLHLSITSTVREFFDFLYEKELKHNQI